jgi:hypothetical protein
MSLIDRTITSEERELLRAMAADAATDKLIRQRAQVVITALDTNSVDQAATASGLSRTTVRKVIQEYNVGGLKSLIPVPVPRGGDFLARYDQGFWAERLVRVFLDRSVTARAIPYGTSRSEIGLDIISR